MVFTALPDGVEEAFRAEGKYPARGMEEHITWIFKKLDSPPPMFVS